MAYSSHLTAADKGVDSVMTLAEAVFAMASGGTHPGTQPGLSTTWLSYSVPLLHVVNGSGKEHHERDRRSGLNGSRSMTVEMTAETFRVVLRTAHTPSRTLTDAKIIDAIPEMGLLARTPQDPVWHPEGNVLVHSLWAADLAAQHAVDEDLTIDARERLVLASLWHDIGKPDTTQIRNGRITSHGHAEVGAQIVVTLGDRLALPDPLVHAVAALVETHMVHFSVRGEPSEKAVRRLDARLRSAGTSFGEWAVLVRCDGDARGSAARADASAPWTSVARRNGLERRR